MNEGCEDVLERMKDDRKNGDLPWTIGEWNEGKTGDLPWTIGEWNDARGTEASKFFKNNGRLRITDDEPSTSIPDAHKQPHNTS